MLGNSRWDSGWQQTILDLVRSLRLFWKGVGTFLHHKEQFSSKILFLFM